MNGLIRPIARTDLRHLRPFAVETQVAGFRAWISLGNYMNFAGGRNGRHRHSYYEVCLVLGGKGRFDVGRGTWPLGPGDLFIARPGDIHEIVSAQRPPLEICFVSFAFRDAPDTDDESVALVRRFEASDRRVVPASDGLARLFAVLVGTETGNDGDRLVRAPLAAALVLEILTRTVPPPASPDPSPDPRLELAFRFMQDNLNRSLSVAELARQACTSERTLRRLVAAACGRTVVEEFRRRRLGAAASLLMARPEYSVARVAAEMGYGDSAQFGREFRRYSGVSPARFRRQGGTVFSSPTAQ